MLFGSEWKEVDGVLCGENYAELQGVTIWFWAVMGESPSVYDTFFQQLPLLASRRILQVKPIRF